MASCLTVREWELEAVSDALKSAERYFRLSISEGRGASARGSPLATDASDAEAAAAAGADAGSDAGSRSAAQAFRLVAATWLLQRFQVARLGFVLSALNIAYLYVMWQVGAEGLGSTQASARCFCMPLCALACDGST